MPQGPIRDWTATVIIFITNFSNQMWKNDMQLVSQAKYLQYKCQSLAKHFSILYQNPKYEMYL